MVTLVTIVVQIILHFAQLGKRQQVLIHHIQAVYFARCCAGAGQVLDTTPVVAVSVGEDTISSRAMMLPSSAAGGVEYSGSRSEPSRVVEIGHAVIRTEDV